MFATKRSGFSMILAIFVVMIIAVLATSILSTATRGAKSVGDRYFLAQANLLADSSIEYAIMRAQGFDATTNCLNRVNIRIDDPNGVHTYDANVSILYSFSGAAPGGSCLYIEQNTGRATTMLIDATVSLNDDANITSEPIRVNKRTQEKL